jgi:DNA recombination protein RmuC
MPEWILPAALLLLLLGLLILIWLQLRPAPNAAAPLIERLERELRDELGRQGQGARADLSGFQQSLMAQSGEALRTQNEQIDSFRGQLAAMQQAVTQALQSASATAAQQAQAAREAQDAAMRRFGDSLNEQVRALAESQQRATESTRATLEQRLVQLQQGNEAKLEQMRLTVDEKLHATLEQRLGESFKQVADRLEAVHKGLGDMQSLARDVGSLSRVLSNVKTRGSFGEVQLANLLEQVFTPEQYAAQVETVPHSRERVDFAIRLPNGRDAESVLWLPIDAKFPREEYDRLLDAQERSDAAAAEAAGKALEQQLKIQARSIRAKYVAAPYTTDFAILFLPTEGLYAEALRRPGLAESLNREHRITLAGPTTLMATLSSLQMGFRTLALEKRSSEVWDVLGAVKTEFGKFGAVLEKTKRKLEEASKTIDDAEVRTRAMNRKLKAVDALPEAQTQALLPGTAAEDEDDEPAPGRRLD